MQHTKYMINNKSQNTWEILNNHKSLKLYLNIQNTQCNKYNTDLLLYQNLQPLIKILSWNKIIHRIHNYTTNRKYFNFDLKLSGLDIAQWLGKVRMFQFFKVSLHDSLGFNLNIALIAFFYTEKSLCQFCLLEFSHKTIS